jgi:hypothetical protein
VYQIDENMKDKFPLKTTTDELADERWTIAKKLLMPWKKKKQSANIQR